MFQIKAQLVTLEFDAAGYTDALKKELDKQARLAGKEFASVALSRIPIRTGFVAGSFGTLTDLLGSSARFNPVVTLVRKAINTFRRSRAANNKIEYYYGGGGKVLKTTTSGRQFASKADDIFKWEGDILTFKYEVDITYFAINDNVSGHSPTAPWGAFIAGKEAFEKYMNFNGLSNLPNYEDYVTEKTTNIG